ncbi:MAG: carbon-nitrogen hydrolase family protein [Bryobacteraceae bacterium]|nr:carbon-nitrogen hydrolase family protein [Bryobacteraceae bacterium]
MLVLIALNAWHSCLGQPASKVRNPLVRVVTISQAGLERNQPDLIERTLERLEQSAAFRPDIATLPEVFAGRDPETVPGPVTKRLAEWARRNSSYVIFGLRTRADGRVYNSAVVLDRDGRVVGRYDKIHPTERELSDGIHPGDPDPPVFQTDFGPIGIQICFDVNWWEGWKRLKEKGARIVFFPAAYPAALHVSALALANQVFVVSSTQSRRSHIYDITGEELAATGRFQEWAGAVLPAGKRLFEVDFHVEKAREIQRKYGQRVEVGWRHDDDWFTLASLDPGLTVEDLIAEFGLTTLDDYRVRAHGAAEAARQEK